MNRRPESNFGGKHKKYTKKEKFLSTLQSRWEQEKLVNPLSAKSNYELAKGEGGFIGG